MPLQQGWCIKILGVCSCCVLLVKLPVEHPFNDHICWQYSCKLYLFRSSFCTKSYYISARLKNVIDIFFFLSSIFIIKNVELENKRRKAAQARVPSDPSAWQQMRENYETIILEDHVFSEQHEIENALWQMHYRRIEELRAHFNAAANSSGTTNGKVHPTSGPDRITKIRTQFKTFLSEATGFYHDLMLKIRAKYGLPLGYNSDDPENQIPSSNDGNKSVELKKGLISCHRCLIYLGDLARYKGLYGEGDSKARDFAAASSYYLQASSLWPSSGNPHHQVFSTIKGQDEY